MSSGKPKSSRSGWERMRSVQPVQPMNKSYRLEQVRSEEPKNKSRGSERVLDKETIHCKKRKEEPVGPLVEPLNTPLN